MTIEAEVAALTVATTNLLTTVNVKKDVLDGYIASTTASAALATTKATDATTQAAAATTFASAANTSATNAATSATNAAASALAAEQIAGFVPASKANVESPTFTGTVGGITKAMVGLGSVDNTADADKPVSTAQATAIATKQSTSEKDASNGYAGMTLFAHNMRNVANTITSFLTNTATAARTWTLPNRSGTLADDTDLALKANLTVAALNSLVSINGGALAGFRNKHIGGDFSRNPWQRGTSFTVTASGTYVADRWRVDFDGTANITVSKVALVTPQLVNGIWCTHGLKFLVNSKSGNTFIRLSQRILGVDTLSGGNAVLQTAILGASAYTIPVNARQSFGTGGAPSADVVTAYASSLAVTAALQQLNTTVAVPSITGKVLGTNNNSYLSTEYNLLSVPATGFVTIPLSGLEPGLVASQWEDRRMVELSLCQDYCFKTYDQGVNPGTITPIGAIAQFAQGASNYSSLYCSFKRTLRAVPNTVTVYSPINGQAGYLDSDGVAKAALTGNAGTNGVMAYVDNIATSLDSYNSAHFVVNAEI